MRPWVDTHVHTLGLVTANRGQWTLGAATEKATRS